jgi:hypothetical protein
MTKVTYPAIITLALAATVAACGGESVCSNSGVLQTVEKLFVQQQFGQVVQVPPKLFVVQSKSATLASIDKQSGQNRCSVLITTDLIEWGRAIGHESEETLAKIKEEAPKQGLALTKDDLVKYIVQPLASGQNHVTVLP